METRILAVVVAATAAFGISGAAPAAATGNNQVVGIEQTVTDPNGTEIAYTVTKILPSADPIAYPVAGQLYEATVMVRAIGGSAGPMAPFFSARAEGGANYPALPNVSALSGAPLQDGGTTDGKIYFDVVGPVPNRVVYDDPPQALLTWSQPIAGVPTGGSTGGGGSTVGGGGAQTGTGSTGPNEASPTTSGGDIGGGQGGTEGGGGGLSSGGGAGAPNGDTGKNNGAGGPGGSGG